MRFEFRLKFELGGRWESGRVRVRVSGSVRERLEFGTGSKGYDRARVMLEVRGPFSAYYNIPMTKTTQHKNI